MKHLIATAALVASSLAFAGAPSTTTAAPEKKKAEKVVVTTRGISAPKEKPAAPPAETSAPGTGTK